MFAGNDRASSTVVKMERVADRGGAAVRPDHVRSITLCLRRARSSNGDPLRSLVRSVRQYTREHRRAISSHATRVASLHHPGVRMRNIRLPLAALLFGLAACQADSFPTTPNATIPGTYKLTTINGVVLPFSFRPDSSLVTGTSDTTVYRETLYQDDYDLLATGRFRYTTVDSALTHTTDGSTDIKDDFSYIYVGSWRQSSNFVLLIADSVTEPGLAPAKLAQPDTFGLPLPTANAISGTATLQHGSLGPNGAVLVDYFFIYAKQ
jgi:hypothetical protein